MKKRGAFVQRQRRTMLLLLALILLISGMAVYIRLRPVRISGLLTSDDIVSDSDLAYARYEDLDDDQCSRVFTAASEGVREKAQLLFCGLPDLPTATAIVEALNAHALSASFFVYGNEVSAHLESLSLILQNGYPIGLAGDSRLVNLSELSSRSIVRSLCNASLSMQSAIGIRPSALLSLTNELNPAMPYCALACDLDSIYSPGRIVTAKEFSTRNDAQTLVGGIPRGTLLSVDVAESGESLAIHIGNLLDALVDSNLTMQADALLNENAGAMADAITAIHTTERAVAFTFSGLGNRAELNHLLDTLASLSAGSVFYVTPEELKLYPEQVRAILGAGHTLGVAVEKQVTTGEIVTAVLEMRETLKADFDYTRQLLIRPAGSGVTEAIRESASALEIPLVMSQLTPVKGDYSRDTDAEKVFTDVFGINRSAFARGQIVHFQMNQYIKSNLLLGDYVLLLAQRKNIYDLRPVDEILANTAYHYEYPLPDEQILPQVKDFIRPGQLLVDVFTAAQQRYVGNSTYSTVTRLPGFTQQEVRKLDKTGLIKNDQNYIFLTFDDWGTDRTIENLLSVLAKHNCKATFFVRSNNIHYNPNLLRAIALEGHSIGCHTNSHFPLSNADPDDSDIAYELSEEQLTALEADLVLNWDTLQRVIGDISINGVASLIPVLRPPTLAISKNGLQKAFECGFTHVVSGSLTTADYSATSAEETYKKLVANTKSGAVFVLHMSDNSLYTAEAVDQYLTYLEGLKKVRYQVVGMNTVYGIQTGMSNMIPLE